MLPPTNPLFDNITCIIFEIRPNESNNSLLLLNPSGGLLRSVYKLLLPLPDAQRQRGEMDLFHISNGHGEFTFRW